MPKTKRTRTRKQTPYHKKQKGGMWPFDPKLPKTKEEADKEIRKLENKINELRALKFPENSAPEPAPTPEPAIVETRQPESVSTGEPVKNQVFLDWDFSGWVVKKRKNALFINK